MRTALIIGAGALAVWFFLRSQSSAIAGVPGTTLAYAPAPSSLRPPASIPTPNTNPSSISGSLSLSGLNNLSNAGCAAIAGSKGVPSGIASDGCKLFSLVTPLGFATAGVHLVEKIPVVGGAVKAVGSTVEGAAKSAYHSLTSWL